jgi:hypothetical protein
MLITLFEDVGIRVINMEENKENKPAESNENQQDSSVAEDATSRLSQEAFDSARNSSANSDNKSSGAGKDTEFPLSTSDRNGLSSQMMQRIALERPGSNDQGQHGVIDQLGREQKVLPKLSLDGANDKLSKLSEEDRKQLCEDILKEMGKGPARIDQWKLPPADRAVPFESNGGGGGNDKSGNNPREIVFEPISFKQPGDVNQPREGNGTFLGSKTEPASDNTGTKALNPTDALKMIKDLNVPIGLDSQGWSPMRPSEIQNGANVLELQKKDSNGGKTADINSPTKDTPSEHKARLELIIPIAGNDKLMQQELKKQADLSAVKSLFAAGEAKDMINKLSPEKREQWNEFQLKIAQSQDPAEREKLRSERNAEFPDVAKRIEEARSLSKDAQNCSQKLNEIADRERASKAAKEQQEEKDPTRDIFGLGSEKGKMPNFDRLKEGVFGNKKGDSDEPKVRLTTLPELSEKNLNELDSPSEQQVMQLKADLIDSKAAQRGVSDADRAKFREDAKKIMENDKFTDAQKHESFDHINRLMDGNSKTGLSDSQCARLGLQVADQIANPTEIDQGQYPTCNVTTVEVGMYSKHPEMAAKIITDLALNGETTIANGDVVKLDKGSLQPTHKDAVSSPKPENVRTHASQIFQLAALNNHLDRHNAQTGQDLRCVNHGAETGNTSDKLMDFSTNPPREVTSIAGGLGAFSCETGILKDADGNVQLDANLNPIKRSAVDMPNLREPDVLAIAERFSNAPSELMISRPDIIQRVALNAGYGPEGVVNVVNTAQLHDHLAKAKAEGRLPIVIGVHTSHGFLKEQADEAAKNANIAAGKPGGAGDPLSGGGHVVSIVDYDPATGKVHIDNQWGKSRDKTGDNAVSLAQALQIMQPPDSSLVGKQIARNVKTQADRREDYQQWCKSEGKTPGKDYPTPQQFKEWDAKRQK